MAQKIFTLYLFTASFISFAQKNIYYKTDFPEKCSKELNHWMHAKECTCKKDFVYMPELGKCLDKEYKTKKIIHKGTIIAPVFAIGGETTSTHLKTKDREFELVLNKKDKKNITNLKAQNIIVYGDEIKIQGIEKKQRILVIVDKFEKSP